MLLGPATEQLPTVYETMYWVMACNAYSSSACIRASRMSRFTWTYGRTKRGFRQL